MVKSSFFGLKVPMLQLAINEDINQTYWSFTFAALPVPQMRQPAMALVKSMLVDRFPFLFSTKGLLAPWTA
jgi:hypothetical protein